jgi:hypothetical protein
MALFFCYLIVLLGSTIAAVGRASVLSPSPLRLFIWFLPVTLLVELAGAALRQAGQLNHWLYNLYLPVNFIFYSWLYYSLVQFPLMRRLIVWSTGVFISVYLINLSLVQGVYTFNSHSYLLCSFLIVVWVLAYFRQLLQSREPLNLARLPAFWISTGVLFSNLGHFLYLGLLNYLLQVNPAWARDFMVVSLLLLILNYSLFIVAFLCQGTQTQPSPRR